MPEARAFSGILAKLTVTIYAKNQSLLSEDIPSSIKICLLAISPSLEFLGTNFVTTSIRQDTYSLSPPIPNLSQARHHDAIAEFERQNNVEIILDVTPSSKSNSPCRPIRLALFDMDSTLINEEVIDELARSVGKTEAVSAITARAMNGEVNFETSLRERVCMLRGVGTDVWEELKRTVTIAEGARELIQGLKKIGVVTGVISGGFIPMAEWLKGELGLDYAFANCVRAIFIFNTRIPWTPYSLFDCLQCSSPNSRLPRDHY